jgi:hypothetical protein
MSILKRRARWFLSGYTIPRSWIFYTLVTPAELARQFSITNGPEFMEQLRRLGAVRETKAR